VSELYQIAAVAVAALECAGRGKAVDTPGIVELQKEIKRLQDALDAKEEPR